MDDEIGPSDNAKNLRWVYFFMVFQTLTMGIIIGSIMSLITYAQCYEPTTDCGSGISDSLADDYEITIYTLWWIQISLLALYGIYWVWKWYNRQKNVILVRRSFPSPVDAHEQWKIAVHPGPHQTEIGLPNPTESIDHQNPDSTNEQ